MTDKQPGRKGPSTSLVILLEWTEPNPSPQTFPPGKAFGIFAPSVEPLSNRTSSDRADQHQRILRAVVKLLSCFYADKDLHTELSLSALHIRRDYWFKSSISALTSPAGMFHQGGGVQRALLFVCNQCFSCQSIGGDAMKRSRGGRRLGCNQPDRKQESLRTPPALVLFGLSRCCSSSIKAAPSAHATTSKCQPV